MDTSKTRTVLVPRYGEMDAPLHVSRVDSPKEEVESNHGWHGWQVRWPGHSRYFSDAQYKHNPASSLRAASRYAKQNYPGKKCQCKKIPGIRVIERQRTRGAAEVYVEVAHPDGSKAAKRLYVGTIRTVTARRLREKKREGRLLRAQLVAEHKALKGLL